MCQWQGERNVYSLLLKFRLNRPWNIVKQNVKKKKNGAAPAKKSKDMSKISKKQNGNRRSFCPICHLEKMLQGN